ncbi:ABC transporter ATP-binding protein [Ciceribacter sp. RN22]|uniref:ABC transporter ATP-binding protein n=1 Tax=Ciceribacter sp. RN22 TaxID=2954932 RepID=UPI002093DDF9|nr:ABC transporter ATP-binding protein [Ciceribacter sp. RN22]MCO6180608.1 ABC transporter ATP-binding protein [Ciceribacter sp. RN22]
MRQGLILDKVAVERGRTTIVSHFSAALVPSQLVAVIGPNGAGKSTLLGAIAGDIPHKGSIRWNGQAVDRAAVGFMPQYCAVRAELSVLQVLLLGRHEKLGWHVGEDDLSAAAEILCSLGLDHLAERPMTTLSGGQQQMVLLAQRLIREPRLLILDEATSALDLRHQIGVLDLLKDYAKRTGALVLIAIHDLNLAARHADSLMLLHNGALVSHGTSSEVLTLPAIRSIYQIEAEVLRCRSGLPVVVPLGVSATGSMSDAAQ